jgi:hypothetical protein
MVLKQSHFLRRQMASWICSARILHPFHHLLSHSNAPPLLSTPVTDLMGGPVFAFVQTDLRNNIAVSRFPFAPPHSTPPLFPFCRHCTIQGVRARYRAHDSTSETLENLVREEAREGGTRHGTACLVRLTRYASTQPRFPILTNKNHKS